MLSLAERVYRTILRYDLLPPGTRVLVAVSGGADSTALALILRELEAGGRFSLSGLAHVHHGLRGAAADADEAFCREMAERLGLRFESSRVDARAEARRCRTSVEDASRRLRYAFLQDVGPTVGRGPDCHRAHGGRPGRDGPARADPGSGPARALRDSACGAGRLSGRCWKSGTPSSWPGSSGAGCLIARTRRTVTRGILRNRVRHELMPLLVRRFSGGIVGVLSRAAAIWDADAAFLDETAARAFEAIAPAHRGRARRGPGRPFGAAPGHWAARRPPGARPSRPGAVRRI